MLFVCWWSNDEAFLLPIWEVKGEKSQIFQASKTDCLDLFGTWVQSCGRIKSGWMDINEIHISIAADTKMLIWGHPPSLVDHWMSTMAINLNHQNRSTFWPMNSGLHLVDPQTLVWQPPFLFQEFPDHGPKQAARSCSNRRLPCSPETGARALGTNRGEVVRWQRLGTSWNLVSILFNVKYYAIYTHTNQILHRRCGCTSTSIKIDIETSWNVPRGQCLQVGSRFLGREEGDQSHGNGQMLQGDCRRTLNPGGPLVYNTQLRFAQLFFSWKDMGAWQWQDDINNNMLEEWTSHIASSHFECQAELDPI